MIETIKKLKFSRLSEHEQILIKYFSDVNIIHLDKYSNCDIYKHKDEILFMKNNINHITYFNYFKFSNIDKNLILKYINLYFKIYIGDFYFNTNLHVIGKKIKVESKFHGNKIFTIDFAENNKVHIINKTDGMTINSDRISPIKTTINGKKCRNCDYSYKSIFY